MSACKVCGNKSAWAPGHPRGLWERTILSWLRFGPVRCEKCGFRQLVPGGWAALSRRMTVTDARVPDPAESAGAPAQTPPPAAPLPQAAVDIPFPENPTPAPDLAFPELIDEMRHAEKRLGLAAAVDGATSDEPTEEDR